MKKGVTVSILAVAVAIMIIAVSAALVMGTKSIKTASYEEYLSKLKRVEDAVNFYEEEHDDLPITGEIISKIGVSAEFSAAVSNNGDSQNDLYIIDMNKLNVISVNIGRYESGSNDIFLLAKNTNNVYYFAGMKYKGTTIFNINR